MKDKEKLILKYLKENGRSSTTKLAWSIKSNVWMALKYLEGLKAKGKIVREKETNATYWSIKKK